MFDIVCQKFKNDLGYLDAFIKDLSKCDQEGKALCTKCAFIFMITQGINEKMKKKHKEIQDLVDQIQKPNRLEDLDKQLPECESNLITDRAQILHDFIHSLPVGCATDKLSGINKEGELART